MMLRTIWVSFKSYQLSQLPGSKGSISQSVDQLLLSALLPVGKVSGTHFVVATRNDGETKAGECCDAGGPSVMCLWVCLSQRCFLPDLPTPGPSPALWLPLYSPSSLSCSLS